MFKLFKRYPIVTILIFLCFLSAFLALFNGADLIAKAEESVLKEIQYGYSNEVIMMVETEKDLDLLDFLRFEQSVDKCNVYLENLGFYCDEGTGFYLPQVVLFSNEPIPYPTLGKSRYVSKGTIWITDSEKAVNGKVYFHSGKVFLEVADVIDSAECEGLAATYVLNAEDYLKIFDEARYSNCISLRIGSNRVDVYETYANLKNAIEECFPQVYIYYLEPQRNTSVSSAFFSMEGILSALITAFAWINVAIISYYWVSIRRKEISVRKAYGATNFEIVRLLLSEALRLIGLSSFLALSIQLLIRFAEGESVSLVELVTVSGIYLAVIAASSIVSILIPLWFVNKIQPAKGVRG